MGSNKYFQEKISFTIITSEEKVLRETINIYNKANNTDFALICIRREEVVFAQIEVSDYAFRDLFNLGYQLRSYQQQLRGKGKII